MEHNDEYDGGWMDRCDVLLPKKLVKYSRAIKLL